MLLDQLAEQRVDRVRVALAGVLRDDVALRVDQHQRRPGPGGVGLPGDELGVVEDRVVHGVALDGLRQRDRVGLVHELRRVHADHDQLVGVLLLQRAQLVEDVQAVDAAEGPEVEQHEAAAQVAQRDVAPSVFSQPGRAARGPGHGAGCPSRHHLVRDGLRSKVTRPSRGVPGRRVVPCGRAGHLNRQESTAGGWTRTRSPEARPPSCPAAGLALALAASPAGAQRVEGGAYHDEFTDVFTNFCGVSGLTVDFTAVVDGHYSANARGPGGTVYFVDHQSPITQTYTNRATGLTATDVQRIVVKDLKITQRRHRRHHHPAGHGRRGHLRTGRQRHRAQSRAVPLPHRVRRQRDPRGRQRRHRDLLRPGQGVHRSHGRLLRGRRPGDQLTARRHRVDDATGRRRTGVDKRRVGARTARTSDGSA